MTSLFCKVLQFSFILSIDFGERYHAGSFWTLIICQCRCESQSSNSLGFPTVSCYLPTKTFLDLETGLLLAPFNTVPLSPPCESATQAAHLISEL